MAERAGRHAAVKVTGTGVSMSGEAMTTADHKTYKINNAVKEIWDKDFDFTVYDDEVETIEAYTLNRLDGEVVFATVDVLRGPITVDGKYLPTSTVAMAYEFSFNRGCDMLSVPRFGDEYKRRLGGQKFASGAMSHWDVQDPYFSDALINASVVVVEFKSSGADNPIRVYCVLESGELKAAVAGVQNAVVQFISSEKVLTLLD